MTGYLRHDAFLPCKFIPGSKNDTVTQVQWGFKETEQNGTVILVSHYQLGVNVHDTFLKDKVEIREQSLIIRDLAARDAGLYTCTISAFPSGSFAASIRLVVRGKRHLQTSQLSRMITGAPCKSRRARVTFLQAEQTPLSSGEVAAVVTAVVSLLVLVAAVYVMLIRRCVCVCVTHMNISNNSPHIPAQTFMFFPLLRPHSSVRCRVRDGEENVSSSFGLYDLKMLLFCGLLRPPDMKRICVFRHTWTGDERRGEPPTLPQTCL